MAGFGVLDVVSGSPRLCETSSPWSPVVAFVEPVRREPDRLLEHPSRRQGTLLEHRRQRLRWRDGQSTAVRRRLRLLHGRRRLGARLGCDVETVAWQSGAPLASYGITPEAAAAELHLVDDDRIMRGHEAVAGALRHSRHAAVRRTRDVIAARLLRPVASRAYRTVAANRQRLPGGTAACALEPASTDKESL